MFACLSLACAVPRGPDTKIIAVPVKEPRLAEIQDLEDIPAHVKEEIHKFFIHYKDLEDTTSFARVTGWSGREEALAKVHRGMARDGGGGRPEGGGLRCGPTICRRFDPKFVVRFGPTSSDGGVRCLICIRFCFVNASCLSMKQVSPPSPLLPETFWVGVL